MVNPPQSLAQRRVPLLRLPTGILSATVEVLALEIFNIRHRRAVVFSVTVVVNKFRADVALVHPCAWCDEKRLSCGFPQVF